MSIDVTWAVEKRVIQVRVHGVVSVEEMVQSSKETDALLSSGLKPVHLLVDVMQLERFPTSVRALKHGTEYRDNPNLGLMVVFGASSLTTTFAQIVLRVTNTQYRIVSTREDALAFLAEQDASVQVS